MKKHGSEIIFWGSLWGFMEVTLGYVVHQLGIALPGLPGFVMFPAAYLLMRNAADSTERKDIILQMSIIAAGLKLLDFWIPGNDPIRIINPALSIVMEGTAVYALMRLSFKSTLTQTFSMGFLWRSAWLGYMMLIDQFGLPAGLVTSGMPVALRFLVIESAVNALIMSGSILLEPIKLTYQPKWQMAFSMGILAIVAQAVL